MFLRAIGERAVVEFAGQDDSETYALENAWCFFTAASAISRMHGWHNQPHETQGKLDALCTRTGLHE